MAPARDRLAHPGAILGTGWRASGDRAVSVAGDATGLHVLVANAASGYAWHTVATLSAPGVDTPQWIGQVCVTGAGRYAVAVYAPRQITNMAAAQGFGGLAAIVNLVSGRVVTLHTGVSIAYFDPGCGTGQDAVLTQSRGADGTAATRLITVNAPTGKIISEVRMAGQVTSAVPYRGQVAAVRGGELVTIGPRGRIHGLAAVAGQAFRLVPDAAGGLGYLVASGGRVQLHRYLAGHDRLLGSARLGSVELSQTGGRVWVTGTAAARLRRLPAGWRAFGGPAQAQLSTTGALAVIAAVTPLNSKSASPIAATPDSAQPVTIEARVTATGRPVVFTVPAARPDPGGAVPASGRAPASGGAPALGAALAPGGAPAPAQRRGGSAANPATVTYDPDRTCSVPRNNPQDEAYQSSPAQEEWAVDQAVRGDLTGARGPNLYGSGLPAYRPQGSSGIFPLPGLTGGGRVPAQVMLGVLAQESAEYQASFHVIDGQAGNPEVGLGWYGDTNPNAPFHVDWAAADCGYGTAQVTTGMCLAGNPHCGSNNSPFPLNSQIAVAIDYQANIAAGLQILEQKWNEVYSHGVKANGADPQRLENWWFALWDYNSGYHPGPAGSPNGLGWVNNPINPMYPPDREMFLSGNYNFDVAHPQNWSYEEKVIGFAAYGLFRFDFVHQKDSLAFAKGGWPANDPPAGEPAHSLFCNSTDNCSPSAAQPCQLSSDECWWHEPATWGSNCADCGAEVMSYPAGAPDPGSPGVPPGYAPDCSNSPLPGGAVIVGDTASSLPAPLGCGTSWSTNGGTMTWQFGADTRTSPATYPSKVDFHQISAGYGGHFWFTHTIPSKSNDPISIAPQQPQFQITGTWKAPSSVTGWTRVMVSIPNYGAWDPQANYQVNLGGSAGTDHQVVNQAYQANTWVSLGIFDLHSGANVSLGNVTFEGLGYDIAWGAVAFIHSPTPGADYVAMGDSYSSGEGLQPFDPNSDYNNAGQEDACHRSGSYGIGQAYSQLVKQPGQSSTIAQQAKNLAGGTQYQFAACSGDFTTGVTEKAVGSPEMANTPWDALHLGWHELPQADAGYLGPQTSLVTLTLGGDDARFSSVLKGCILTKGDCTDSNFFMKDTSTGKLDPQPLIQYEPQVINNLQQHLEDVYTAIAKAAPNAKIIVLGYPRLFPGDTSDPNGCQVDAAIDIPGDVTSWLNKMGDLIDQVTANAVKSAAASGDKIFYVDPRSAFNNNEICNLDGTENSSQWINGLINFSKSGSGRQVPGAGSFHPRAAGQVEYAKLANACLASAANC